jgi:uncharacterized protein YndB with AHSA1/START domain
MFEPALRLGAQIRRVGTRQHEGMTVHVVEATRSYDTDPDDLWNALTDRERIPRWFTPIEGELRLGGRYQLRGNAGGTITRCEPPQALDLTWEFSGATSWVTVRLDSDAAGTRLTLEHLLPDNEHWDKFGPAAVGVGWDLSFLGLGQHLASGGTPVDHDAAHTWMASPDGKDFMRTSAEAWRVAHVAGGAPQDVAAAMATRTAAFYTGEHDAH